MTATLERAAEIWREEGPKELAWKSIKYGYNNSIRQLLPKRVVSYNGFSVRAYRLGDSIVPWQERNIPDYEEALVDGIQQYVEVDDTVVVVGGGWGVSTVVAASQIGDGGEVITFEGSAKTVKKVKDTIELNNINARISVQHAIVGQALSLRGAKGDANVVKPTELPECDVLTLDCEGAEIEILDQMEISPRAIIVETHGMLDAPESEVRDKLQDFGYDIIESRVAERRSKKFCEENGIYVLFGTRRECQSEQEVEI